MTGLLRVCLPSTNASLPAGWCLDFDSTAIRQSFNSHSTAI